MAKKTSKKPYKFRQARKDAKAGAKGVFEGKKPSGRKAAVKDITTKQTLEEREALKELSEARKRQKAGKADFITTDKGERVSVKPTETAEERMARDRAAAKEAAYRKYPLEEGEKPAKKVEATKKFKKKAVAKTAADKEVAKNTKKFGSEKPLRVVDTPVTKGGELEKKLKAEKKMTRAEKSAANKAKWAKMTPAERKNWSATKGAAEVKAAPKVAKTSPTAAGTKRPTLASLKKNEAAELKRAAERVAAKKAAAPTPAAKAAAKNKALADSAKGKTQTPQAVEARKKAAAKPEGKAPVKKPAAKPSKYPRLKALGKAGAVGAVAGEVVSLAKGSTKKDFDEINRLEQKLANLTGKGKSRVTAGRQGAQQQLSQLASLATMGIVGKTRRQRMDELNKLIKKAGPKELRYGPKGESLVPGTKAYKAGSKTKPAYTKTSTGAGGATTKPSGVYTVKKGDTLSGIAKANETTLAALREANPKLMKRKKYKQGSMIWSGTTVKIPKK